MNVFVAGASGTIGVPLVRALVAAGHHVTALTRSPGKREALQTLGASPVIANALDRDALVGAVVAAHPTHVIHQLTALPREGPRRASDVEATNRLRRDGTRNLLQAAISSHARRFIVGSFAPLAASAPATMQNAAAAAVRSMESQVLEATRQGLIDGIVLRYGMFYGPGVPSTAALVELVRKRRWPVVRGDAGQLPIIHIDDAVSATLLALDRAYLRAAGLIPERDVCGVIGLAGPYDFLPQASDAVKAVFGPIEAWPRSQPINYASALAPPMLLLAGKTDRSVDPGNTLRLASRLHAAGAIVQVHLEPGISHRAIIVAFADTLAFLAPVRRQTLDFIASQVTCGERISEASAARFQPAPATRE